MQFVSWKPVLRAPASILHKLPIPTGIVDLSGNRDQLWFNYIAGTSGRPKRTRCIQSVSKLICIEDLPGKVFIM